MQLFVHKKKLFNKVFIIIIIVVAVAIAAIVVIIVIMILYSRYVLPKLAWHLTITSISKTWITENLDSTFVQYIHKWLELPISGTLSNVCLISNKFGLNIIPPSTKFIQCQTTIRSTLKSSPNESITHLWKLTKNNTNIQYDQYSATKEVIKSVTIKKIN